MVGKKQRVIVRTQTARWPRSSPKFRLAWHISTHAGICAKSASDHSGSARPDQRARLGDLPEDRGRGTIPSMILPHTHKNAVETSDLSEAIDRLCRTMTRCFLPTWRP